MDNYPFHHDLGFHPILPQRPIFDISDLRNRRGRGRGCRQALQKYLTQQNQQQDAKVDSILDIYN